MRAFVVVLACALFVGCAGGIPDSVGQLTGTHGVEISTTQTPSVVYENEEFSLSYELVNRGAADISFEDPGYIFVSHDPLYLEYVGITSRYPENAFYLDGRTRFFSGEGTFANLHFRAKDIERFSSRVSTSISATVCYPYSSNVTAQVCIEQRRSTDPGEVACRNTPVRPASPAAPIGVEEVEVRSGRTTVQGEEVLVPQFRITLRNYGEGIPSASSCVSGDSSLLNMAELEVSVLNERLVCRGSEEDGLVRFSRGRATITCSVPENSRTVFSGAQGNFLSLLSVDLDYTYRESVRTQLEVRR